jgi:hypothetical protein
MAARMAPATSRSPALAVATKTARLEAPQAEGAPAQPMLKSGFPGTSDDEESESPRRTDRGEDDWLTGHPVHPGAQAAAAARVAPTAAAASMNHPPVEARRPIAAPAASMLASESLPALLQAPSALDRHETAELAPAAAASSSSGPMPVAVDAVDYVPFQAGPAKPWGKPENVTGHKAYGLTQRDGQVVLPIKSPYNYGGRAHAGGYPALYGGNQKRGKKNTFQNTIAREVQEESQKVSEVFPDNFGDPRKIVGAPKYHFFPTELKPRRPVAPGVLADSFEMAGELQIPKHLLISKDKDEFLNKLKSLTDKHRPVHNTAKDRDASEAEWRNSHSMTALFEHLHPHLAAEAHAEPAARNASSSGGAGRPQGAASSPRSSGIGNNRAEGSSGTSGQKRRRSPSLPSSPSAFHAGPASAPTHQSPQHSSSRRQPNPSSAPGGQQQAGFALPAHQQAEQQWQRQHRQRQQQQQQHAQRAAIHSSFSSAAAASAPTRQPSQHDFPQHRPYRSSGSLGEHQRANVALPGYQQAAAYPLQQPQVQGAALLHRYASPLLTQPNLFGQRQPPPASNIPILPPSASWTQGPPDRYGSTGPRSADPRARTAEDQDRRPSRSRSRSRSPKLEPERK